MGDTSKQPFDPDVEAAQLAIRLVRSLEATHRKIEVAQSFVRIVANVAQGHAAVYGERILRAAQDAKQAATVLAVRAAERHVFGDEATTAPARAERPRSRTNAEARSLAKKDVRGKAERRRAPSAQGNDRAATHASTPGDEPASAPPPHAKTRPRRSAPGRADGAVPAAPESAIRGATEATDPVDEPASRKRAIA